MADNLPQSPIEPRIVRARLDSLKIYEVSEGELESIERGGPQSLFLNFAIFFVSNAISFTVALTLADFKSDRTFLVFVVVAVVSWAAALVLGSLWFRSFRSKENIVQT